MKEALARARDALANKIALYVEGEGFDLDEVGPLPNLQCAIAVLEELDVLAKGGSGLPEGMTGAPLGSEEGDGKLVTGKEQ